MPRPLEQHVFLSYSRADIQACRVFQGELERASLKVFRDEDRIRAGDRWVARLEDALANCIAFVVLVGRDGIGQWVGVEVQYALKRHLSAVPEDRLPIFPVLLPGSEPDRLPPLLSLIQATRWVPGEAVPPTLVESIHARASLLEPLPAFEGCPYIGLDSFDAKRANLFFGRRQETLEALACLGDQTGTSPDVVRSAAGKYVRWLQVEGNSGAGKSSLVHAGVLPMIEGGALWASTGYEHWRVLGSMTPGGDPVYRLADILEQSLLEDAVQRDLTARRRRLVEDNSHLAALLRNHRKSDTAYLLVVDQFEEIFTLADPDSRRQFDALIANALGDADCPFFLITTVRADFLEQFDRLPQLQRHYNRGCKRYFLPPISEQGLREVIEQPARLADLDVREVSAVILEDARAEPGALPLVENALYCLWSQRVGRSLSAEQYRASNGIAGMLADQADALLTQIDDEVPRGRDDALELLLALTRAGEGGRHSRRRLSRQEAVTIAGAGNADHGEQIVGRLSGERGKHEGSGSRRTGAGPLRLITVTTEAGQPQVDLIHETLVRSRNSGADGKPRPYWPTLYEYVEANRDRDLRRQQLTLASDTWDQARGLSRFLQLAYLDVFKYRGLRVLPDSPEGRYLRASKAALLAVTMFVLILASVVAEAFYWTRVNDLPVEAMVTLERFRLGYEPMPKMKEIPPGTVTLGERDAAFIARLPEPRRQFFGIPGRMATIDKPFLMGVYEVTYDEFDFYVWDRQRTGAADVKYPATAKGGRGSRPVVQVTWAEASRYATWLGGRRNTECRLPTEAEWEHAARAGTSSAFWWGETPGPNRANCFKCGGRADPEKSMPIGSFDANRFGLHDMLGNVWEWNCSEWKPEFGDQLLEQSCAAMTGGALHTARGGSYGFDTDDSRASSRRGFASTDHRPNIGFRVLCQDKR